MWEGINKRKFPRANYRCLLAIGREQSLRYLLTHTENIGVGGICAILDDHLPVFSRVDIELALKDERAPVQCAGNVVWGVKNRSFKNSRQITRFDTGIEFIDLKTSDRERIEKIVSKIAKTQTEKIDAGR